MAIQIKLKKGDTVERGLKKLKKILDKEGLLKTLRDNFPTLHPNIAPDSVEYTVVCVD